MEIRHFYQFRFEYILAQFFFRFSIVQSSIIHALKFQRKYSFENNSCSLAMIQYDTFIKFEYILGQFSIVLFPSSVPSSMLLNFKENTLLRFLFIGSRYDTFINFEYILGQFSIVPKFHHPCS